MHLQSRDSLSEQANESCSSSPLDMTSMGPSSLRPHFGPEPYLAHTSLAKVYHVVQATRKVAG
jgi:hypothetical protein